MNQVNAQEIMSILDDSAPHDLQYVQRMRGLDMYQSDIDILSLFAYCLCLFFRLDVCFLGLIFATVQFLQTLF